MQIILKQEAAVTVNSRGNNSRDHFRVQFYRNDIYQFDVLCRDRSFADKLATAWREGGTQATIAQLVHNA